MVETKRLPGEVHRRRRCLDPECGKTFFTAETAPAAQKWPKALTHESLARLRQHPNWRAR